MVGKRCVSAVAVMCIWSISLVDAQAGNIVIASDDWIFTNTGFSSRPVDTTNFAINVAEFLTGGTGASIHAYSSYQSLAQSSLTNALNSAGYSYTTGTDIAFDLATLSHYDALFFGSDIPSAAQLDVLSEYVSNGGGLYIHGGLGHNNPGGTAAGWNDFLSQYDLAFGPSFMSLNGAVPISSTYPLFEGVSSLYMVNGHTITGGGVIATTTGGAPLFAVSEIDEVPVVPAPGAIWLVVAGLGGVLRFRRSVTL